MSSGEDIPNVPRYQIDGNGCLWELANGGRAMVGRKADPEDADSSIHMSSGEFFFRIISSPDFASGSEGFNKRIGCE